jgi:hypothetical protein
MHSCDHCFFLTVKLSCVCAVVCSTNMHSCSHILILTDVCVCVVCVGARACSFSGSPPRADVLSQNWIQLYVLNPTFSTPEVRLCTRTHLTHTITHSLTHAHHSRYSFTHHMDISRKVNIKRSDLKLFSGRNRD